jgi:hypothetical protein
MFCLAASTDRRAARPFMTNGDFRIHGQNPGDLEYEPWKDGASWGYRFDMAALNPQWPALRISDADRDEAIKVLREGSADGRLSHDTFLHRMELALQARDAGQLASLLSDLRPAARRASVAGRAATRWQEFAGQLRDAWWTSACRAWCCPAVAGRSSLSAAPAAPTWRYPI